MKTKVNIITYPAFAFVAFACFALSPTAQALLPPPAPDGGYPGENTAEGSNALFNLTSGANNTALGFSALLRDTTGNQNTATGTQALAGGVPMVGNYNTANGFQALFKNTTGDDNVATGALALSHNTTGSQNVADGTGALGSDTVGGGNTAVGENALTSNIRGSNNVAVGNGALFHANGNQNIALGYLAGSNSGVGGGNVYIGAQMLGNSGDINRTYIANISSTSVSGAGTDTATVNLTTGLIGHLTSSRRYKEEIKPMENASETIYRLHPVTYRYKKAIDRTQSPAFGLIAEEVAEVNPNLVACDAKGQPESVHYEAVNAMLLNEFLKEHRKVEQLEKQVEKLTTGLQKVSAQLELSKPASRTVLNNH